MIGNPDGTFTCMVCGRVCQTETFARMHAVSFHAAAPATVVQQFAAMVRGTAERKARRR